MKSQTKKKISKLQEIDLVILGLKKLWYEHPTLRLGELISSAIDANHQAFIDDKDFIALLNKYYSLPENIEYFGKIESERK